MSAVERLDPRRDMGLIRERIERLLIDGGDPLPTIADLAGRNPIALADLVVGPKAIRNSAWIGAALTELEPLESALSPNALYQRLAELAPDRSIDILTAAARRHPGAAWLVAFSRRTEGDHAGRTHLGLERMTAVLHTLIPLLGAAGVVVAFGDAGEVVRGIVGAIAVLVETPKGGRGALEIVSWQRGESRFRRRAEAAAVTFRLKVERAEVAAVLLDAR